MQLKDLPIDYSWSFADKTIKDTSYITHGYYTYPAKFIPQLAQRLINEYSNVGDIVVDPFCGSGTTIVESIVNKRIGIGTDVNDIALLISKVKTTPISTILLYETMKNIENKVRNRIEHNISCVEIYDKLNLERINYWYVPESRDKLALLLEEILFQQNSDVRDFFLVGFCQILKTCSIWLQKSVKPTRDLHKKVYDPIDTFLSRIQKMISKHDTFNKYFGKNTDIDSIRRVIASDARNIPLEDNNATLIVTSPPYVTSYEYADLHQLPLLWLGYIDELSDYRHRFIGSSYKTRDTIDLRSEIANHIVEQLGETKKSIEVRNYFADMLEVWQESSRVLKRGGRACVVIGNTVYKGVDILNAEVFVEQFQDIGFKVDGIVHREIPSKMLPSTREANTGRFAKKQDSDNLVYPTEFILIMKKI